MIKKILLTGFEPFHKATSNPTADIVNYLETQGIAGVSTAILPVEFGTCWKTLRDLIDRERPDFVIALGQAEGRSQITPERIAINLDDARIPDNAGNQPKNRAIVDGGPDGLFTTLPVDQIVDLLNDAGICASNSLSAGTFVCNHLFYSLQHYCQNLEIKSGFIHVPLMESQTAEFPGLPTMKLEDMVQGIHLIIRDLLN